MMELEELLKQLQEAEESILKDGTISAEELERELGL